jgi:TonB-dependent starch-binding outer membrane protein SusC
MKKYVSGILILIVRLYSWKTFVIMKTLIVILFLMAYEAYSGSSYSQNTMLSLDMKDVTVAEVLEEIEKLSEFDFLFNARLIDTDRKVSIVATNQSVLYILEQLFNGTSIDFKVFNRHIVLSQRQPPGNMIIEEELKRTVRGSVVDQYGESLTGVSVVVKGSMRGTTTDVEGRYSFNNLLPDAVLQFSFVGMKTHEVVVGNQTVIDMVMEFDAIGLAEVVAVGYSLQKKVNLTGSVAVADFSDITDKSFTNAGSALQGRASGVYITHSSGRAGSDNATIRIRGYTTISTSNNPLVLIDGVEGNLFNVDPSDIESVSILKDAASAAIYGNRAANGVILITTKRAKRNQELKVTYNTYFGVERATMLPELLTDPVLVTRLENYASRNIGGRNLWSEEEIDAYANAFRVNDRNFPFNLSQADLARFYSTENVAGTGRPPGYYQSVDWVDLWYNPAAIQRHSITVTGGSNQISNMLSMSYLDQEGIKYGSWAKRYNVRANTDAYFLHNDKLHAQMDLQVYRRESDDAGSTIGNTYESGAHHMHVLRGYYLPNDYFENTARVFASINEGALNRIISDHVNGKFAMNYEVLSKLFLRADYSAVINMTSFKEFTPRTEVDQDRQIRVLPSALTERRTEREQYTFNALADYDLSLGRHHFFLLGGYSTQEVNFSMIRAGISDLFTNFQPVLSLGDTESQTIGSNDWSFGLRSYFGRLTYNFDDRYLIETNLRYDGSSRFAEGNRWGLFPSFSAAWRLSEEEFLKPVLWLDNLKIRGSYGKLGNQNVDNYAASSILMPGINYPFNNSLRSGVALTYIANRDISWETTKQTNFGVDLDFFGRLSVAFDIYDKISEDILLQLPIPSTTGINQAPYQNAASMQNKGWELSFSYRERFGNLRLGAQTNLSHFKTKVLDLKGTGPHFQAANVLALFEGEEYWVYWGLKQGGIVRSEEELASIPKQPFTMAIGDIWYEDQDGDGIVNEANDRTIIGSPHPDLVYSFQFSAQYKGFDLVTLFEGVLGVDAFTMNGFYEPANNSSLAYWGESLIWEEGGQHSWLPRPWASHRRRINSSFYIQDASYFRVKDITVGYTLPKSLMNRVGINNVRLYVNLHNYFTISDFIGFDADRDHFGRTGHQDHPLTKSTNFGIQVDF